MNNKEKRRAYYLKHKDRILRRIKARTACHRKENTKYLSQYLRQNPCIDCGETDAIVLQFDHIHGTKKGNITTLAGSGYKLNTIKSELMKCEVRCANCHLRRHFYENINNLCLEEFYGEIN